MYKICFGTRCTYFKSKKNKFLASESTFTFGDNVWIESWFWDVICIGIVWKPTFTEWWK